MYITLVVYFLATGGVFKLFCHRITFSMVEYYSNGSEEVKSYFFSCIFLFPIAASVRLLSL